MKAITLEEIDRYIANSEGQDEASNLRPASSYVDEVIKKMTETANFGVNKLPWNKSLGNLNLRPAEVTLWLGFNGHGKSMILGQIANHLMEVGDKVCIASMEMRPAATLSRMTRQGTGLRSPSIEFIRAYHAWTDGKLWIYDQHGHVAPNRIENLIRYAVSLGITHVVVDSLMKVVQAEDDYNAQKRFVDSLCILARDHQVHIHLVHHSRKLQDENKAPGKLDAKGSGAISDLVDNCITVFRKKSAQGSEADCFLIVDKQRHGEWEGSIALWYDPESQAYAENELRKPAKVRLNLEHMEESF